MNSRDRLRIAEQAALRLIRSQGEDSAQARAELLSWSRLSAHHVHELLFAQAVSRELDGLDPQHEIDVDALPTLPELTSSLQEHDSPAESLAAAVTPTPAPAAVPTAESAHSGHTAFGARRRPRSHWAAALAATLAIVFAGALWMNRDASSYATTVGEQRSIKLSDGSVMILNTGSRAKVRFSPTARQIQLIEGEALFVVRHSPVRPFEVSTSSGTVVAVGTQFNVYKQGSDTRVSVIEGAVQISAEAPNAARTAGTNRPREADGGSARLNAGDEAVIGQGRVVKTTKPDIQRVVAWRTRQLMFRDSPLAEVAEEFNRYNPTRIRVEGAELRSRSISGVFDADDAEPLIDFLASDPRLSVVRNAGVTVIKPRN